MTMQVASVLETPQVSRKDFPLSQLLGQRAPFDPEQLGAEAASWLSELRERAKALVQDSLLPTTREEEWRFTDLSELSQIDFQPAQLNQVPINFRLIPETQGTALVFVNGVLVQAPAKLPAGLVLTNLQSALGDPVLSGQVQQSLGQQQGASEGFTALNTAGFEDVAVLQVQRNCTIDHPVQVLFVSMPDATPTTAFPRCLVILEPGSSLTLVEEYQSVGRSAFFTNAVTEIYLQENAQLTHTRLQREAAMGFHIGKTAVSQARDSRYSCFAMTMGAQLSRHNLEVFQLGPQTETTLNGLTAIAGDQLADTHSLISYTQPYGTSRQLHKCIVNDSARAVFNGRVWVPKAAQLTDAGQLNRTLLLSPKARVDTKPQLEIVADNVKCSHGATVSQLEPEELFYLQSRGLDQATAQKLLIHAFAAEIITKIPVASLREQLLQLTACRR